MIVWLAAAAVAATWQVELSSTDALRGRWPVRTALSEPCADDEERRMLGVAAVVYSKKGGVSSWGHASMRFLWCEAGRVHDVEYESYRLGPSDHPILPVMMPGEDFAHDRDYLRSQHGALLWYRNDDPVDAGFFGEAARKNRELYELWMPVSEAEAATLLADLEATYQEQLVRMRAREPMLGRYRAFDTNCTMPLRELSAFGFGDDLIERSFPFAFERALESQAIWRVVHPSHAVLRRLVRRAGGWEAFVAEWEARDGLYDRPRPVLRGSRRLPDEVREGLDVLQPTPRSTERALRESASRAERDGEEGVR